MKGPPGESELLALKEIDDESTQLQKRGDYLEALKCLEKGLVLRQRLFGTDSDQLWNACRVVGDLCNLLAMTYLQKNDYGLSLELLKKAEILTERHGPGRAVTCNNLACFYRKRGKLRTSLQYLQRALRIESKLDLVENVADTHLNACAVLSQLGHHRNALEHAQSALILLQEELLRDGLETTKTATTRDDSEENEEKDRKVTIKLDRIGVLAIAYHNMGVELEFLRQYDRSYQSYRKGQDVAETYLGRDHDMAVTLRNSCQVASQRRRDMEAAQPTAK